jgi:HEPN domain-containing protein
MLVTKQLLEIARARILDAKILLEAKRFHGAMYLCGYAVEVRLKWRICKTLGWKEFPEKDGEFKGLGTFKTHDLDVLLRLSGTEALVKRRYFAEWSQVAQWDPEVRYKPIGTATKPDAQQMFTAASTLAKVL